jgi:hypothetical protein
VNSPLAGKLTAGGRPQTSLTFAFLGRVLGSEPSARVVLSSSPGFGCLALKQVLAVAGSPPHARTATAGPTARHAASAVVSFRRRCGINKSRSQPSPTTEAQALPGQGRAGRQAHRHSSASRPSRRRKPHTRTHWLGRRRSRSAARGCLFCCRLIASLLLPRRRLLVASESNPFPPTPRAPADTDPELGRAEARPPPEAFSPARRGDGSYLGGGGGG